MKVTAVMPEELKESLKAFAESKRWTMSQAIGYLVERGLEDVEESNESSPKGKK